MPGALEFVSYAAGRGVEVFFVTNREREEEPPTRQNLFARGFEHRPGNRQPDLITCYEAFEHFVDPVAEIEKVLSISGNILFTTELLPSPVPKPEKWWYYGLNHGQHVSFYSLKALELLAARYRLQLSTNGRNLHFLGSKKIGKARFSIPLVLKNLGFANVVRLLNGSKTWEDMRKIQEDERRRRGEAKRD